jgi:hypothetical protein
VALLLLHPGDLPLWFWLVPVVVMLVVGLGFGVVLSLVLKKFLPRRPSARREPEDQA